MFKKIQISQADLARHLNIPRQALTNWKDRYGRIPNNYAKQTLDYLDLKSEALYNYRQELEKQILGEQK